MAANSFLINPHIRPLSYDPLKSFAGVCELVQIPQVVAVNAHSPWKTLAELVAAAKAASVGAKTVKGPGPFSVFTRSAAVSALARVVKLPFATAVSTRSFAGALVALFALEAFFVVAPAVAGVLWGFLFNPSVGIVAWVLKGIGIDFNYVSNGNQALLLIVIAAVWNQISYNFLFFLAGLQSIPKSLIEAAAIESERPSPPIIVSQRQGRAGASFPSTSAKAGLIGSAFTARAIARCNGSALAMLSIFGLAPLTSASSRSANKASLSPCSRSMSAPSAAMSSSILPAA